jgi:16S rRNA (uracil1498-N3)-methyltransferase
MTRICVDVELSEGLRLPLPEEAARHVAQVLRMRAGESLILFNGRGGEFEAVIAEADRRRVQVEVGRWIKTERESRLQLLLAQCVSKGDRMDYSIQKAVELGVSRIVPLLSERSVVKLDAERWDKKLEHWRGVIVSACEQSGRSVVPPIEDVQKLDRWLATPSVPTRLVLAPGGAALRSLVPAQEAALIVGPEGGLSESEIQLAERLGCVRIGLGPRILRTETAGVAAMSALQTLWGDF